MEDRGKNRSDVKFTDLDVLSADLNVNNHENFNAELCFSRYAMDYVLKKYSKLPDGFKIHALLEHGVIITEYVGGAFRAHEYLPSIVSSKYRVGILEREKNFNGAFAIGPYIHYVDSLMDNDQFKMEKERLGKSLLVFPTHSIEGSISKFDYNGFSSEIKKYSDDFDSVRICMYYKDVQLGRHKFYQKEGFEVVTAGHFNDLNFLPRLRSIIELSDMTMSNDVGTHLGYCIYLKKSHFIDLNQNTKYIAEKDDRNSKLIMDNTKIAEDVKNKNDNVRSINNLFSVFDENITKDQYDLISYLWGFDEVKTPDELKNLFLKINEDFSWIKYYTSALSRLKTIMLNGR